MQDLDIALPMVKKMIRENARLTTIYKELRNQGRFEGIGDYPMISWIAHLTGDMRVVTTKEVVKLLKLSEDCEFQKIHQDNDLVTGICARFRS